MTEKMIIDAYCRIRTIDSTIPDEVLDFMKQASIEKLRVIESNNKPVREPEKIKIFFKEKMSFSRKGISYSPSPNKPSLFLQRLKRRENFDKKFSIESRWLPYTEKDFDYAHFPLYIYQFFTGRGEYCESNSIKWSEGFADSIKYTNASLFEAIKYSYLYPEIVCCSPTSGFHHATPTSGKGFCTFSGQVIASMKMYEEFKAVGCYFDLDGHFGNSIEDTRKSKRFTEKVNQCIPEWANINPSGINEKYMTELSEGLKLFKQKAISKEVNYVVWCHGADSHSDDDLGLNKVGTIQWGLCTEMFVQTISEIENILGRPFPVSYSLFGGYQKDFEKVLDLHEMDTEILFRICTNRIR